MSWLFVYLFFTGEYVVHSLERAAVDLNNHPITSVAACVDEALERQNAINHILKIDPNLEPNIDYVMVICREVK